MSGLIITIYSKNQNLVHSSGATAANLRLFVMDISDRGKEVGVIRELMSNASMIIFSDMETPPNFKLEKFKLYFNECCKSFNINEENTTALYYSYKGLNHEQIATKMDVYLNTLNKRYTRMFADLEVKNINELFIKIGIVSNYLLF